MLACEGKLAHLGLDKAPPRSTLSDANNRRSYLVFETIYFKLLKQYHSFISDSRLKGLSIRNLKIIDSTTIRLFSDILRGVGRNPLDGSSKKGGIKVRQRLNPVQSVCQMDKPEGLVCHAYERQCRLSCHQGDQGQHPKEDPQRGFERTVRHTGIQGRL